MKYLILLFMAVSLNAQVGLNDWDDKEMKEYAKDTPVRVQNTIIKELIDKDGNNLITKKTLDKLTIKDDKHRKPSKIETDLKLKLVGE